MWQHPSIKVIKELDSPRTHEMENMFILLILHSKGNFTQVSPFSKPEGETEARSPKYKLKIFITNLFFIFLFPCLPSVRAHRHPSCSLFHNTGLSPFPWSSTPRISKGVEISPIVTFPNRTGSGTLIQAHVKVQQNRPILDSQLS